MNVAQNMLMKKRRVAYNTSYKYLKFTNKNQCYIFPRETCICSKRLKTNQVYISGSGKGREMGVVGFWLSLAFYFKMGLK